MEAQLQSYLQEKGVEDLLKDIVVELCKEVTLCRAGLSRANAARALRVAIHSAAAHPLAERARPFRPSSLGAGTAVPLLLPLSLLSRLRLAPPSPSEYLAQSCVGGRTHKDVCGEVNGPRSRRGRIYSVVTLPLC